MPLPIHTRQKLPVALPGSGPAILRFDMVNLQFEMAGFAR
jgi:hypothetical protein